MLYHTHELRRIALQPARLMAEAGQYVLSNPLNPWSQTWTGKAMSAALTVFEEATRRFDKPSFGLHHTVIDGVDVPVTEEIVGRRAFCQLRHFAREGRTGDPRLLIVAPLSGHYATLLRGTVESLLPDHDIYITDWRNARDVPLSEGRFDLDDYIDYVRDYLRLLGPNTHVMAVCQPAVPVFAAVALMSQDDDPCVPSSMTLMGGPIDTRKSPTAPNRLAKERTYEWFEQKMITRVPPTAPGFMREVYPGFLQLTGFLAMNWDRHVESHVNYYNHLVDGDGDNAQKHREFYEEYMAVMDLPAEYYLQTIRVVFQEHLLPRGMMVHRDRLVRPEAIRKTALLTVEGENDDISGPGQTQATHPLCINLPESMQRDYIQPKVGHYGVFNGKRWHTEIAPRVRDFIRAFDQPAS
ncbi:polyhydroxyalkanoate depolymerase [Emcibacter sp. SYSU 3D8]|uniref:polyhydroxyalkanoate depolymerase n=1 Tax=Emcibacter sp. SYSU 3D8 TaxID=3133969 RepID=UPI0031FE6B7E